MIQIFLQLQKLKALIRIVFTLLFVLGCAYAGFAQNDSLNQQKPILQVPAATDSARPAPPVKKAPAVVKRVAADSVKKPVVISEQAVVATDSTSLIAVKDTLPKFSPKDAYGSFASNYIAAHPWFATGSNTVSMPSQRYAPAVKDGLFYIICGLLFFLGILRVGFPKYFDDVFGLFWRSPFRQKQTRDQLQQAGMTTLLFNIFFVCSAALFSYLLVLYLKGQVAQPWLLYLICFLTIAFLYTGKYFILKITGWMFGEEDAANGYIFIVFLINKVLAVLLIPIILILAFSSPELQQIAFTVSIVLVIFLLIYRFILSFTSLRNELKISGLHLFLYVCGFEIIPVLVIYKSLLHLFERSL